jgi:hypothetical protein
MANATIADVRRNDGSLSAASDVVNGAAPDSVRNMITSCYRSAGTWMTEFQDLSFVKSGSLNTHQPSRESQTDSNHADSGVGLSPLKSDSKSELRRNAKPGKTVPPSSVSLASRIRTDFRSS